VPLKSKEPAGCRRYERKILRQKNAVGVSVCDDAVHLVHLGHRQEFLCY
jgi:hypothetical protein